MEVNDEKYSQMFFNKINVFILVACVNGQLTGGSFNWFLKKQIHVFAKFCKQRTGDGGTVALLPSKVMTSKWLGVTIGQIVCVHNHKPEAQLLTVV